MTAFIGIPSRRPQGRAGNADRIRCPRLPRLDGGSQLRAHDGRLPDALPGVFRHVRCVTRGCRRERRPLGASLGLSASALRAPQTKWQTPLLWHTVAAADPHRAVLFLASTRTADRAEPGRRAAHAPADRPLPQATLSAQEMTCLLNVPDVTRVLGLRDRAILEVFYSCAVRRAELISLWVRDVDAERGTLFVRSGKGAKDRYVPIGERALFWVRLYSENHTPTPGRRKDGRSPVFVLFGHPDLSRLALPQDPRVLEACGNRETRKLSPSASQCGDAPVRRRGRHPVRRRDARPRTA